jgi:dethiobiotin synthetase
MRFRPIYVAATSQHVGKTTTTLGLVSTYMKMGYEVGYCKPVGQKFLNIQNLKVDKDTLLFADLIHFNLDPSVHSPVILGKGATTKFLENPTKYDLGGMIDNAANILKDKKELIIFEGTGHPGVGSIANLSNADVAKRVGAGVVMVVEGGIGKTIDMANMCLSLFREKKVPIIGVIVNKVFADRIDKVKYYVGKKLEEMGLPLLGVIPYDQTLAYPLMRTVSKAIDGRVIYNEDKLDNKVEDILAGSLIDLKELKSSNDLLLVVSTQRVENAIRKIESISKMLKLDHSPLSGIVATGYGEIKGRSVRYIKKHRIPIIRTHLDTYGSVIKISRIEVKINRSTPWKISRAIELIENNVDLEKILSQVKI